MKRRLYLVGAVLLIVAGVVGLAGAEFGIGQHGWGFHGPGRFPAAFIAHELNLSDAQKTQIKGIWNAERPTVTPLLRQILSGCDQMASANANGNFDEAKARAIADEQATTVSQLFVERERLISRIYNEVLTPEQRVKADQLRERMHGHIEGLLDHLDRSND
ncbi:MAG TPA: Spy/CpxP family protein refolding chaperone [Terriglobales bacterium]|nr:Spy/CpxP family protein refolding chaperone [Terriglobales bacterium]